MTKRTAHSDFKEVVTTYYKKHGRSMPWRDDTCPYYILVSEIMLQQTQVDRVVPKFKLFIDTFPTIESLAAAPLSAVLKAWSGLGYNRRAKYLHESAIKVSADYCGTVPKTIKELMSLPGIGPNTAGAILVYAYNQPTVYIETNIRAVFLHHFFKGQHNIDDAQILPIIEKTLDLSNPRLWYWALMDYGAHLKKTIVNPSRASKHHVKQSVFNGSIRQTRGTVMKALVSSDCNFTRLKELTGDDRLELVLSNLVEEGLVSITSAHTYSLKK